MTGSSAVRGRREGFVLIAVLSVLTLLSAMVVVLMTMSRDSVGAALLSTAETRQRAMFQSGISLAAYQLFQLGLAPERVGGQQFRVDEGMIELAVATDAGKADLNASGKDLLAAAYKAAGLTALEPASFAGRVIDWRDDDDARFDDGAEGSDYAEAKLDHRPRNGPFRNVDDLRWVLGVSVGDIRALGKFVTVHNPRGRLNAYAAPAAIVAALPKVTPETVEQVLEVRTNPGIAAKEQLDDLLLVQASLIDTAPPVTYRVTVRAQLQGSPGPREIEAIIAADVVNGDPFHVLHWTGD